jgi:beta-lactamase class D
MRKLEHLARWLALSAVLVAACGCAPQAGSGRAGAAAVDKPKLEDGIDRLMGGADTCVVLADAHGGDLLYQYGNPEVCMRPLPPCSTFKIANSLIGLDLGLVTPRTVFKWDGTPQPVKAWEADADMTKAFKDSMVWWYQRLARLVGHDRYVQRLKAFDYGDRDPAGPVDGFWLGPKAGGGLSISTRQQIDFLRRFYGGRLPVKPEAAAFVRAIMVDETRLDAKGGRYVMSGKTGACSTRIDGSRGVGWWVGRLETPDRDLVFAASVEAAQAPPGQEVSQRIKDVFADAGLWPAAD